MKNIKEIIAQNLVDLRKKNNLTQNDLAKKLNYSDNTISRWEHAEITPSIETLQLISEIYSITIEDLLRENTTKELEKDNKDIFYNKLAATLILSSTIWFIAVLVFIYSNTFMKVNYWMAFIWAIPLTCLCLLNFNRFWKNKVYGFIILTVMIWTKLLAIYLELIKYNLFLIFIVGIPLQISLSIQTFIKKRKS